MSVWLTIPALTAYLYPPSLIKQYPWLSVPPIAQLIHSSACSSYRLSDAAYLKVVLWGPLLPLCLFFVFYFSFFHSTRFERRFWEDGATFIIDVTHSLVVWDLPPILDWCEDAIGMKCSICLVVRAAQQQTFSAPPLSLKQRRLFKRADMKRNSRI